LLHDNSSWSRAGKYSPRNGNPLIHASWGGAEIKNKQVFESYYDEIMSSWVTTSADEGGLIYVPEE